MQNRISARKSQNRALKCIFCAFTSFRRTFIVGNLQVLTQNPDSNFSSSSGKQTFGTQTLRWWQDSFQNSECICRNVTTVFEPMKVFACQMNGHATFAFLEDSLKRAPRRRLIVRESVAQKNVEFLVFILQPPGSQKHNKCPIVCSWDS